jgi:hypothetical protein
MQRTREERGRPTQAHKHTLLPQQVEALLANPVLLEYYLRPPRPPATPVEFLPRRIRSAVLFSSRISFTEESF